MSRVPAAQVVDRLAGRLPRGEAPFVVDLARSHGSWLVDARDGRELLDLAMSFGSSPLGANAFDAQEFVVAAQAKPANWRFATTYLAEFIDAFDRVLGDPRLPYLFLVEGGAVAVENALKVAFDWKSRHNEQHGRPAERGTKVMHLTNAFHGRTGYTLSLTNTDPVKTDRFPRFDWPRIETPTEESEPRSLAQAEAFFRTYEHDIACFIAEPIQGEGGDNHLRAEFLLAMQNLCHRYDALFVLDEVQTGVGTTGSAWAYQQFGLQPDVVAFGKKLQVCGLMAGGRLDEVEGHVFRTPGRINTTWGGGLVDIVRATRVLEIIERDDLFTAAARAGGWFVAELEALEQRWPQVFSNARGRGLMCAIDLPDPAMRADALRKLAEEGVLALPCGQRTIRFRPALNVQADELAIGIAALDRVAAKQTGQNEADETVHKGAFV